MRRWKWAPLALVCLAIGGCLVPVDSAGFTCVICRRSRTVTTYAFLPIREERDEECSRWYASHVEPRHDHRWQYLYGSKNDLWGSWVSSGSITTNAMYLLPPGTQLHVYQQFRDPLEARALFLELARAEDPDDWLGEKVDLDHRTVTALKTWEEAGFPGTWDAWFAPQREEHEQFLEWMRSSSGVSFWDWKKQRAAAAP